MTGRAQQHTDVLRQFGLWGGAMLAEQLVERDPPSACGTDRLEPAVLADRLGDCVMDEWNIGARKPALKLLVDTALAAVGQQRQLVGEALELQRLDGGLIGGAHDDNPCAE